MTTLFRKQEKYKVFRANTQRMKNSPIIYMQHLLNKDHEESPTPLPAEEDLTLDRCSADL